MQQDKLSPVQERIGQDPPVVKPVHETGKSGGMWRRGFTGPADVTSGIRVMGGPDFLLSVDYTGTTIVPNIASAVALRYASPMTTRMCNGRTRLGTPVCPTVTTLSAQSGPRR